MTDMIVEARGVTRAFAMPAGPVVAVRDVEVVVDDLRLEAEKGEDVVREDPQLFVGHPAFPQRGRLAL